MATRADEGESRPAVVYDSLRVLGGAESVTRSLAEATAAEAVWVAQLARQFGSGGSWPTLHSLKVRSESAPFFAIGAIRAFRRVRSRLKSYNSLWFSGSYAPAAASSYPGQRRFYYCHTPPRLAYDLKEAYLERLPAWQRPLQRSVAWWIRREFRRGIDNMHAVIANSQVVQGRLERALGFQSEIIYPPVHTEQFHWREPEGYYLSTARLEPFKRVGAIIRAFKNMPDKNLVVASGGSGIRQLWALADGAPNIWFTGWVSAVAMQELLAGCIATIYLPKEEDFGISPIESLAAGKPVIGTTEGGLVETLEHEKTALLLPPSFVPEQLEQAIRELDADRAIAMREACERRAADFSYARFARQIADVERRVSDQPAVEGTRLRTVAS